MKLIVNIAQPFTGDVGVNLRGVNAGVAEEFLDDPQVRSAFEQMRCETVA